jgi:large subunit ribosomal protein L4
MLIKCYDQNGKVISQIRLPAEVFGLKINPDLVHQVLVLQLANRRKRLAKVKTRAEVRGGGRKPWRQKGTGRARVGSIRSPLWRGGGVVFGPRKERKFKKKIPKKMRRKALLMVLSGKAKEGLLILVDKLKLDQPKTKLMKKILEKLPCKEESCLIALPQYDRNLVLATRNLPEVDTIWARNLNVLDLLSYKYLLLPKEALKLIKETFIK